MNTYIYLLLFIFCYCYFAANGRGGIRPPSTPPTLSYHMSSLRLCSPGWAKPASSYPSSKEWRRTRRHPECLDCSFTLAANEVRVHQGAQHLYQSHQIVVVSAVTVMLLPFTSSNCIVQECSIEICKRKIRCRLNGRMIHCEGCHVSA